MTDSQRRAEIDSLIHHTERALHLEPDTILLMPYGQNSYNITWKQPDKTLAFQTEFGLTLDQIAAYFRGALWFAAFNPLRG